MAPCSPLAEGVDSLLEKVQISSVPLWPKQCHQNRWNSLTFLCVSCYQSSRVALILSDLGESVADRLRADLSLLDKHHPGLGRGLKDFKSTSQA